MSWSESPSTIETLTPRMRRRLAGDLDNIVLMALRKDVSRRYGSAEQLSEDIRRHLQGLPIQARRDTLLYRGGKFLRRNQWAVTAALLVAASLVTGTVIAVRQARAAQARFDQLRGFARTVLVDLHAQLNDIPGTAKARQALISYVDDYLKRVAAQHAGDDTALATEFATTYLRLGEMQGATPEAIASFENGRLLLERKRLRAKPDPADVLVLARLRVTAGSTLMDLGRTPEAIENLQAAESLAASLDSAIGWNTEAKLLKAWAEWRLARLYRIQFQLQKAEQYGRSAISACEEMRQHGVQTREMYEIFDGARMVLAGVLRRQGNWPLSLDLYQKVLTDTERRVEEDPSSGGLQRALAHIHQIVGDMLINVPGRRQEVLLHVHKAIEIAERLAALDPSDKTAQSELAQYLSSGGEDLVDPQDWQESMRYLRRCLPIFEKLLQQEPNSSVYQVYYALTEADVGHRLAERNRIPESIVWLRRGLLHLRQLIESDPGNTTQVLELLKVQRFLVARLARAGQEQESLALANDLIAKSRSVWHHGLGPELDVELPRAYTTMAFACRVLHKREESHRWYRMAFEEWEALRSTGFMSPETEAQMEQAKKEAEFRW
jgi:tetratricopeptide (TPR) repeat protein